MIMYYYDGQEMSHTELLMKMRNAGIQSGYRKAHIDHLKDLASKGNEKAKELIKHITVKD